MLIFQLQGRLGNQMWGLSDAHLLHKISGKSVLLDLSQCNVEESYKDFYDYLNELHWLAVARLKFNPAVSAHDLKVLQKDDFINPENALGYRGFSASYSLLRQSDLFREGELPKFIPRKNVEQDYDFISLSVRRGDYWQNPHLGVLPHSYYVKALKAIDSDWERLKICLFGDELSNNFIKKLPRDVRSRVSTISDASSPIEDLEKLSRAKFSIIANSTFSFLSAYFSTSQKIVVPKPFYLNMDGWNQSLGSARAIDVQYTKFRQLRYVRLVMQKKFRGIR